MTLKEKLTIGVKAIELKKAGKEKESIALEKSIPLPSFMAKFVKEQFGVDFLIKGGYNLSEAEEEYGQGWLTR
jgi:hypothetical protein